MTLPSKWHAKHPVSDQNSQHVGPEGGHFYHEALSVFIFATTKGQITIWNNMVKTYESRIPPSTNLDKVTLSFDKLNNPDLFHQIHGVYLAK